MASFGKSIQRERQLRAITLIDVSRETKISVEYLNALERNDFRKLPGGVFNRGYVRAYAQYIGVDPEGMVQAYVAEERTRGVEDKTEDLALLKSSLAAAVERQAQRRKATFRRRRARALLFATLLVLGALAAVGGYYFEDRLREAFAELSVVVSKP